MQARDIMTTGPACCTPEASVADATRLMAEHDCGCIPVVSAAGDGCVIGVITDRDIAVRGVAQGRGPETSVGELMTESVFCCRADTDVHDVEDLMSDRQVRRVVVVDDGGCLLGMVSQADLARAAERSPDISDEEVGRVVERISEPAREWRL